MYRCVGARAANVPRPRRTITTDHTRTGAANNIVKTHDASGGALGPESAAARSLRKEDKGGAQDDKAGTAADDRAVCIKLDPTPGAATRAKMVLKRQGFLP
jgi:hypothetical protein